MKLPGPLRELLLPPPAHGVLGVFSHVDSTAAAIRSLKAGGHGDAITVYSPVPRHELDDALAQPTSPVRMWTLIGGMAGCGVGAWITLYMSYDWPVVVGGKPVGSIPPYVIIMFEMTVLFGALTTILGLLFNALLASRHHGAVAYDPRFSNDKFGVFIRCGADQTAAMENLLKGAGAEEVRHA